MLLNVYDLDCAYTSSYLIISSIIHHMYYVSLKLCYCFFCYRKVYYFDENYLLLLITNREKTSLTEFHYSDAGELYLYNLF